MEGPANSDSKLHSPSERINQLERLIQETLPVAQILLERTYPEASRVTKFQFGIVLTQKEFWSLTEVLLVIGHELNCRQFESVG